MSTNPHERIIQISAVASRMAGLEEAATGLYAISIGMKIAQIMSAKLAARNYATAAMLIIANKITAMVLLGGALAALGGPVGLLALGAAGVAAALAMYSAAGGFREAGPVVKPTFQVAGLAPGARYLETPTYITVNMDTLNTKKDVREVAEEIVAYLHESQKQEI